MIVGWGWNDGGYSPGSGVGRSEGYSGGATHHFEDEGFRVRQIGQVIQRWKTSAAHHVVELGLHLLLDQRLADGEDHGPLQRRFDRLTAGTEHVTDDLLHLTICAPKFQHVIDSGFNWWLFFFYYGWVEVNSPASLPSKRLSWRPSSLAFWISRMYESMTSRMLLASNVDLWKSTISW